MVDRKDVERKVRECLDAKLARLKECFKHSYALDQLDDFEEYLKGKIVSYLMDGGGWQYEKTIDEYDPESDVEYEIASVLREMYENMEDY